MAKEMNLQEWPILTEVLLAYELFRLEDSSGRTGVGASLGWAVDGVSDQHVVWRTDPNSENSLALSLLIQDACGEMTTPIGVANA